MSDDLISPVIEFDHVSKFFGSFCALRDVHFSVQQSEVCALLGPNGAGKTTLIGLLAGLMRATAGSVRVAGRPVTISSIETRRLLGIVPQELVYDPFLRVREALKIQSGLYDVKADRYWVDELLMELGLADVSKRTMNQLSGGMKRRLMVAMALVHRPPVIVLDEPTVGVDVERRVALWQFFKRLNQNGHTILLTTHYLKEVEFLCDRVAFIQKGQLVVFGSLKDFLQRSGEVFVRFSLPTNAQVPHRWRSFIAQQNEDSYLLVVERYDQLTDFFSEFVPLGLQQLVIEDPSLEDLYLRFSAASANP